MNKYGSKVKQTVAAVKRFNQCERKAAFATEEEAMFPGQLAYRCRYCDKFHRSGQLSSLLSRVRNKKK